MQRRPPRSTRTDTLLPYTTLFRSYVAGFTLLAAMGRAEARDLNLFGGTLFEPGFSRKTTPGPPALDIDPDSGIEFVPAAPGHSVDDGVPPTAVRPAPLELRAPDSAARP